MGRVTPRDREIVATLALRVRVLSLAQIARTWWEPEVAGGSVRERLRHLVRAGWLSTLRPNLHPELPLCAPLVAWCVGDPEPRFGAVAHQLKARWTEASAPTPVFVATKKAAHHFGGTHGIRRPLQLNHDYHVAALYVQLLREKPLSAALWISEETLAPERRHEKLPDAVLRAPDGTISLVLEFGGSYDAEHVRRVHVDCVRRALPYELW